LSSNTTYSYSLTAIRNSTGVAPTGAGYAPRSASATTWAFGGSNISATNATSTSLRISGTLINNAVGASWNYRIRRLVSGGSFVTVRAYRTVDAGLSESFDFIDSGLSSSTQYFYYLEAVNTSTGNIVQYFPSTGFVATAGTTLAPIPNPPTSVSASTNRTDGINISWSGASGTITSYGVWWGPEPSDSSTPDFTIATSGTSGSVLDSGAPVGSRQYWVRSQRSGVGNSAWVPSGGVTGTRLSAAPVFSDTTVTGTWIVGQNYSTAADRTVQASDATSYSIITASPNVNVFPSWLSINSSGQLSGTPTASGTYTFRVSASNDAGTATSSNITIIVNPALSWIDETLADQLRLNVSYSDAVSATNSPTFSIDSVVESPTNFFLFLPGVSLNKTTGVISGTPTQQGIFTKTIRASNANGAITKSFTLYVNPIGKKFTDSSNSSPLTTLKRFDPTATPTQWVFVNTAKRYNGTSWEDIDNF
jgi:hypothetical protein